VAVICPLRYKGENPTDLFVHSPFRRVAHSSRRDEKAGFSVGPRLLSAQAHSITWSAGTARYHISQRLSAVRLGRFAVGSGGYFAVGFATSGTIWYQTG